MKKDIRRRLARLMALLEEYEFETTQKSGARIFTAIFLSRYEKCEDFQGEAEDNENIL